MKIHLIAIGGSAMHNIALALHKKGFLITGSDDAIYEPSKSKLKQHHLLPSKMGWFPDKITKDIDVIILGMHAKDDNPELIKAQKIGIPILSYPEYIYQECKSKKRVVISGSHGKTSITAMILHVLKNTNIDFDYMVGAQLNGFDTMVRISDTASVIIIEGDEYLSSAIDRRPKFHLYNADIAVISGIAWDHVNVFPTFDIYVDQFRKFKETINETLIYFSGDKILSKIVNEKKSCKTIPYKTPDYKTQNGITVIEGKELLIFGEHNLQNLNAARLICNELEINDEKFYNSISTFKGAGNRLELIKKNNTAAIYKDFAHSPSKLKATTHAVKKQFPKRKLIACMELHTFSSLNKQFLSQYKGCIDNADIAIIYYNPSNIIKKKLPNISYQDIIKGFNREDLKIFTDSEELLTFLKEIKWINKNILMMSSGNFNNINIKEIIQ